MFKETIEEIRDKVVELDNIYSDAIAVDAVSCSSVIHEFVEDIQKKLDELIELENKKRISLSCKIIDELRDSREKVEELEKQIEKKDARIEKLRGDNHNLKCEFDALRNDNKALVERIEEFNRDLDSANRENDDIRRELNKKANRLHDEIANKDNRIEALVKDNENLRKNIGELERERRISIPSKLIDDNCNLNREIERLKDENEFLKDQCDIWEDTAWENDDRATKFYNELKSTKLENENLRKDNTCLLNQLKKLERESDERIFNKTADELMKKIYERVNDALMNMNNEKEN